MGNILHYTTLHITSPLEEINALAAARPLISGMCTDFLQLSVLMAHAELWQRAIRIRSPYQPTSAATDWLS